MKVFEKCLLSVIYICYKVNKEIETRKKEWKRRCLVVKAEEWDGEASFQWFRVREGSVKCRQKKCMTFYGRASDYWCRGEQMQVEWANQMFDGDSRGLDNGAGC